MNIPVFLVIVFFSALIGTAVGEILRLLFPSAGALSFLFTSLAPAWKVDSIDLIVFTFGFSLALTVNLLTIAGMIVGAVAAFRKA